MQSTECSLVSSEQLMSQVEQALGVIRSRQACGRCGRDFNSKGASL